MDEDAKRAKPRKPLHHPRLGEGLREKGAALGKLLSDERKDKGRSRVKDEEAIARR